MRVVLAYAGSLEGSAAIEWLREQGAEVATVTLDLGQGRELEGIRDRALALGARRAHVMDTRDAFARGYVLPALKADACHDARVPMAAALSRPLIAKTLVQVAGIERADAVAHTGRVVDGLSRLDVLIAALAPALAVRRPVREWTYGPAQLAAFSRAHGIGFPGDATARIESNFWGRVLRPLTGESEVSGFAVRPLAECPDEPAQVDLSFAHGVPTALNGVGLPLHEMVAGLTTLATTHGIGPVSVGGHMCDVAAASLLHAGHRALTQAASGADLARAANQATAAYVDLVEQAGWFSPLRDALDAFFESAQSRVNGHVQLTLHKGTYATTTTALTAAAPAVPVRLVTSPLAH